MVENYAKIIQVIADANGVVGRKKLQKMIYIDNQMDLDNYFLLYFDT